MINQPESHTALYDACQEILRLEQVNAELLDQLKIARRELHACQAVMHLSGYGFDPAYVDDAKVALKTIDAAIAKTEVKHD